MVYVTNYLLIMGMSSNGAWSGKQLKILGLDIMKLRKGWKDRVIGQKITQEQFDEFIALKDKHLKKKHPELYPA